MVVRTDNCVGVLVMLVTVLNADGGSYFGSIDLVGNFSGGRLLSGLCSVSTPITYKHGL